MLKLKTPLKARFSSGSHWWRECWIHCCQWRGTTANQTTTSVQFWMSSPQSHVWICTKSIWFDRPPFLTSFPKRQRGSVLFYLPWLNVSIHPVSILNIYLSARKTIFGQKIDASEPVQIGDHRPEQWGMRFEIQRSKDLFQSVTWSQRFEFIFIFASFKLLASFLSILV